MMTREEAAFEYFLGQWVEMYGLTENTAITLLKHDITSCEKLLQLQEEDITSIGIPVGQKCLLRGAILQYRETRKNVDTLIMKDYLDQSQDNETRKKKKRSMILFVIIIL